MATQKQIDILVKAGYTQPQIQNMPYNELSQKIGEILSKGKKPEEKVEVVKMNAPKPSNGVFHLSPEEVRCRALEMAFNFDKERGQLEDYFAMAEGIEEWILR